MIHSHCRGHPGCSMYFKALILILYIFAQEVSPPAPYRPLAERMNPDRFLVSFDVSGSLWVSFCVCVTQAAFRVYDKLAAYEEFEYGYTLKVRSCVCLLLC